MVRHLILVGSYSNSVLTLQFDTDRPNVLENIAALDVGHHPSWVAAHPLDPTLAITGLEQADGKLLVLKYDLKTGTGKIVSEATSEGRDPCSILVDTAAGQVLAGNYSSGSVYVAPISTDAPYLSPSGYKVEFSGTGPDKSRQDGSHPHQVIFHPEYDELFVPDLGADVVRRLKKDPATGKWTQVGHIGFELGGGPRHVAFHNGDLFTLLELSSKVVRHRLLPLPQPPKFIASKDTVSKPLPKPNEMLAAEILIPKPNSSFPTAYLYLSNRNDPSPEGDIISVFAIENLEDPLQLVSEVRTGLNHVRGIEFFGPDDRFLIAGGNYGGGVKVFERVDGGKGLRVVAEIPSIKAPTSFLVIQP